jgi:hypothetical protein
MSEFPIEILVLLWIVWLIHQNKIRTDKGMKDYGS